MLHQERAQAAREAKVKAAVESARDKRTKGLALWQSMMAKIPDER